MSDAAAIDPKLGIRIQYFKKTDSGIESKYLTL